MIAANCGFVKGITGTISSLPIGGLRAEAGLSPIHFLIDAEFEKALEPFGLLGRACGV
jgi:hypothetical protein